MNRKLFASLFALAFAICIHAGVVSQQMAQDLARDFLSNKIPQVKGSSGTLDLELVMEQCARKRNSTVPLFYIFNFGNDSGFIIMSATDATVSVLGWSNCGSFDPENISDGLQYLIDNYTEELKSSVWEDVSGSVLQQAKTSARTFTGQRLLQTAEWGQSYPFNYKLPVNFITGCGATAAAIIMKYHNWPDVGQGQHSVWNKEMKKSLSTTLNTYYDWDNMPVFTQQSYNSQSVKALSDLLYDVSVCSNTDFNSAEKGGSGSSSYDLTNVLSRYFKYKRTALIDKKYYSDQAWDSILHVEIDNNRPVLYSGHDSNGSNGHAFVVDGYDNAFYHVNFGWNGKENGYFILSNLVFETKKFDFSYGQQAIIHIEPDRSNRKYVYAPVFADNDHTAISADEKTVRKGIPFNVCVKDITALEERTVYLALLDSNLVVKERLATIGKLKESTAYSYCFRDNCLSLKNADPTDYIGLVTYDPYDYSTEIVDYAFGDNSQNRHAWIPAYDNTLKYHNITYEYNGSSIKASLYPEGQTKVVFGMPFYVKVQPSDAVFFKNTDSIQVTVGSSDDLIIETNFLEYYKQGKKVGYNPVFLILSMSDNPNITLNFKEWTTTGAETIPAEHSDNKTYNLNGYRIQSAVAPGIYINDGIKVLKE